MLLTKKMGWHRDCRTATIQAFLSTKCISGLQELYRFPIYASTLSASGTLCCYCVQFWSVTVSGCVSLCNNCSDSDEVALEWQRSWTQYICQPCHLLGSFHKPEGSNTLLYSLSLQMFCHFRKSCIFCVCWFLKLRWLCTHISKQMQPEQWCIYLESLQHWVDTISIIRWKYLVRISEQLTLFSPHRCSKHCQTWWKSHYDLCFLLLPCICWCSEGEIVDGSDLILHLLSCFFQQCFLFWSFPH